MDLNDRELVRVNVLLACSRTATLRNHMVQ